MTAHGDYAHAMAGLRRILDRRDEEPNSLYSNVRWKKADHAYVMSKLLPAARRVAKGRAKEYLEEWYYVFLYHIAEYPKWVKLAADVGLSVSQARTCVEWWRKFIHQYKSDYLRNRALDKITGIGDPFVSIPGVGLVVDATVVRMARPLDPVTQRMYYCGKHKCCCFKFQTVTDTRGVCIRLSGVFPGAAHDFHIYQLTRTSAWAVRQLGDETRPCLILADSGYQSKDPQLVLPIKKSKFHPHLTAEEKAHNLRIGQNRIIVEQFNGRLKEKFRMFFRQYFGNHAAFEEYLTAAVWLTNIDIKLHPIKADDVRDESDGYEEEEYEREDY